MTIFYGVVAILLLLTVGMLSILCVRRIQPGRAGVITGWGGLRVSFDWMLRVPLIQTFHVVDISVKKLEIQRKGKDGLVCKDNIRADIVVAFYIRVEAYEDVTVPAGTFKAFKVRTTDTMGNDNVVWFSPELGIFVKQNNRRTAQHAQGPGTRDIELVSQSIRR